MNPEAKPVVSDDRLPGLVEVFHRELPALLKLLLAVREQLRQQAFPGSQVIALRKKQAARLVGINPRTLERLLSAGKFPRADAYAGRCPLWRRETLERWVADGGGRV
jgi:hypothetical protein